MFVTHSKCLYEPFSLSLWLFIYYLSYCFVYYFVYTWLWSQGRLDIGPPKRTLYRFTLLLIEKVTFCFHLLILNKIFMTCSLNRISLGECIDLQILSIKIFPIFRIKSSLRVYLVGQSRPYRAPFLGLLVVWLRFAYFLEFLPDGWNILFELFCYVTPIKFTTFYQNK